MDRPGAATQMQQRMIQSATRRFLRTREEAAGKFSWSDARFLTEIPPTTAEGRYDLAPLAFLIYAEGQVWQFGGNDVMRVGLTWSFVEGPFVHGVCDAKKVGDTQRSLLTALELSLIHISEPTRPY